VQFCGPHVLDFPPPSSCAVGKNPQSHGTIWPLLPEPHATSRRIHGRRRRGMGWGSSCSCSSAASMAGGGSGRWWLCSVWRGAPRRRIRGQSGGGSARSLSAPAARCAATAAGGCTTGGATAGGAARTGSPYRRSVARCAATAAGGSAAGGATVGGAARAGSPYRRPAAAAPPPRPTSPLPGNRGIRGAGLDPGRARSSRCPSLHLLRGRREVDLRCRQILRLLETSRPSFLAPHARSRPCRRQRWRGSAGLPLDLLREVELGPGSSGGEETSAGRERGAERGAGGVSKEGGVLVGAHA
jgi:hypothetical protein